MRAFLRQLGRELGWTETFIRATVARYGEVQCADVRELQALYGGIPDQDPGAAGQGPDAQGDADPGRSEPDRGIVELRRHA